MKSTFKEAAIILIAAVIIALTVNALRPNGMSLLNNGQKENATVQTGTVKEMDIQSAMAAYKSQKALFVDARSQDEFKSGHIRGAANLPEQEFQNWIEKILHEIDPGTEIIVYCSGIECSQAKDLAENLFQTGFIHVSYFSGGFSQWREYNLPVE
jgi:rhodanese-related sulfurtransferase